MIANSYFSYSENSANSANSVNSANSANSDSDNFRLLNIIFQKSDAIYL